MKSTPSEALIASHEDLIDTATTAILHTIANTATQAAKQGALSVETVQGLAHLASALSRTRGDQPQTNVAVGVQTQVVVSPEKHAEMQDKLARYHERLKQSEPARLATDRALLEQRARARAKETTVALPEPVSTPAEKPRAEDNSYLKGGVLRQAEWERRRRVWAYQQIANV